MKKSMFLKIFLVFLVGTIIISATNFVFAATDDDLAAALREADGEYNESNNTKANNTNTNTNTNNTNTNTNTNNTNVNNTGALSTGNINKTSNNSVNTTNSIPKTGISDSIPTAVLVVVFGISAVYAYKKIKEYQNV